MREEVGISEGTLMKVAVVKGNQFLLTPQSTVDRPLALVEKRPSPFMAALRSAQEEAKQNGTSKLTMKEINAEIAAYRKEKRLKTSKQRGQ